MVSLSDMMKASAGLVTHHADNDLSQIFAEEPVSLDVFIKDKKFLGNPPLSLVQYEAVRHTERIFYPDLYPIMAKEFGGEYWNTPCRMVNFISLQWGKGCLASYEQVYDSYSGQWVTVSEAAELMTQGMYAVNEDGTTEHLPGAPALEHGQQRLTARTDGPPFKRGHGRCVRVTTASGGTVDVYEGHLFVSQETNEVLYANRYQLAKPVWKKAGQLETGDRVAVLSKLDCLEPVTLDSREVELVGYWIGDGSMPMKDSLQWGFYADSNATELISRYTKLVESYPGISAKHEPMQSKAIRIRATVSSGDYSHGSCQYPESGHSESPYLKRGLCNTHYTKERLAGRLSQWELSSRYNPLIEIIRKYGLYGSRAWDKRVPPEFFSLPDEQLAVFLSALWDTDGSIYFSKCGAPNLEYCTVSEGLARDIQKLLYRFGVVSRLTSRIPTYSYKNEKREGKRAWRLNIAKDQYAKQLLSILRLHGEKERRRHQGLLYICSSPQQIQQGDIYWDTVASIEDIGEHDYWDMHIPSSGTYVAGGIPLLSSNSGKRSHLSCSFNACCLFVDVSY